MNNEPEEEEMNDPCKECEEEYNDYIVKSWEDALWGYQC